MPSSGLTIVSCHIATFGVLLPIASDQVDTDASRDSLLSLIGRTDQNLFLKPLIQIRILQRKNLVV